MKRFIDIHIPITSCNLNCQYCYVAQENGINSKASPYKYSVEQIGIALSKQRLGGICHFNLCGLGETLIPKETFEITKQLLQNGHFVMIVTNGTLTNRIKKYVTLPEYLRKRLGFKVSFHYLELLKNNLLEQFFENIDIIRKNGISFSLEMTPTDELEPYINDIKKICLKNVGALCHLTIPRDMTKDNIVLLSHHSLDEFYQIWKSFDSEMFDFKYKLWGEKRKEFCYAGLWSGLLNIGTGNMSQCYGLCCSQNILENPKGRIQWYPIGQNCDMPHCYNSHSLLALGVIPEIYGNYALERDRLDVRDGSHWLNSEMREFLSDRLENNNVLLNKWQKEKENLGQRIRIFKKKIIGRIRKMLHYR